MVRLVLFFSVLSSITWANDTCENLFPAKPPIQNNILIKAPALENGMYPAFDKIKLEDFIPAATELVARAKQTVEQIKAVQTPTFENVILPLEKINHDDAQLGGVLGFLEGSVTSDAVVNIQSQISKLNTALVTEMYTDPQLARQVEEVQKQSDKLDPDQKRLVSEYFRGFKNNGLYLDVAQQARMKAIKLELVQAQEQFQSNVLKDAQKFSYYLDNERRLSGLSAEVLGALHEAAVKKGKTGYLVTLNPGVMIEILKNADERALRKRVRMAWTKRGNNKNEFNNSENAIKIAALRNEMAQLLGFKTFEEYALENRIAKNPDTLEKFVNELVSVYKPAADHEAEELEQFSRAHGGPHTLEGWDMEYWSNKMLKEKIGFDEEAAKPYLKYENVERGLFGLAGDLYGLKFKPRKDLPVPHADVVTYEVTDREGQLLSYLLVDRYAREDKNSGAWMMNLLPTYEENGKRRVPVVSINMNYLKPAGDMPTLLSINDIVTLFHEFGHGLHGMLSKARYYSQSGTAVQRDFVELPSQVMENFVFEPQILKTFAQHYQTGETIPDAIIEKIVASKQFRSGAAGLRQMKLVILDLAWHQGKMAELKGTLGEREAALFAPYTSGAADTDIATSTFFTHVFGGGYASGYYSYKWAEVLDADAFSIFKQEGLTNPETAERFRINILEVGGSVDPMEAYIKFARRPPKIDAMLERDGLKKN